MNLKFQLNRWCAGVVRVETLEMTKNNESNATQTYAARSEFKQIQGAKITLLNRNKKVHKHFIFNKVIYLALKIIIAVRST